MIRTFYCIAALCFILQGSAMPGEHRIPEPPEGRPNIVLIFLDDMGYSDPVCSASRAGLLTGCYPNRVGIEGALMPFHKHGLHPGGGNPARDPETGQLQNDLHRKMAFGPSQGISAPSTRV